MAKLEKLFGSQALELENAFFLKENEELLKKLRELKKLEETKENLKLVSGISNEKILAKFIELGVTPAILSSLVIIPLIEVAWADGKLDDAERKAVLNAAQSEGLGKFAVNRAILEEWLTIRPSEKLFEAWHHYVRAISEQFSTEQKQSLIDPLLSYAEDIARATGGIFGLGKIAKSEKETIEKIRKSLEG